MAGIYMSFEGVDGPVTTSGFEKCLELDKCEWGFLRPTDQRTHAPTGLPQLHEVKITRASDAASPLLVQSGLINKAAKKVVISFTATAKDKVSTYFTLELTDCLITSYDLSQEGTGKPNETLKLNYTKISYTFTGRDPKLGGKPVNVMYDLRSGT